MDLSGQSNQLTPSVSNSDHIQGNSTATITLVEYGDYQCPACKVAHKIIRSLQQQLGDQIRFVFRHFPQSHIHPEAFHAAEAAEAAAAQNKFWEMHNHLLENQLQLADGYLLEYAIAFSLDINQFLHEMSSDCHVPRVQADLESGIQSQVTRTPTFFINGVKYNDEQGVEALIEEIHKTQFLG